MFFSALCLLITCTCVIGGITTHNYETQHLITTFNSSTRLPRQIDHEKLQHEKIFNFLINKYVESYDWSSFLPPVSTHNIVSVANSEASSYHTRIISSYTSFSMSHRHTVQLTHSVHSVHPNSVHSEPNCTFCPVGPLTSFPVLLLLLTSFSSFATHVHSSVMLNEC